MYSASAIREHAQSGPCEPRCFAEPLRPARLPASSGVLRDRTLPRPATHAARPSNAYVPRETYGLPESRRNPPSTAAHGGASLQTGFRLTHGRLPLPESTRVLRESSEAAETRKAEQAHFTLVRSCAYA